MRKERMFITQQDLGWSPIMALNPRTEDSGCSWLCKCLPHSAFYRAISRCAAGAHEGYEMGHFSSVAWSLLARVYINL